LIAPRIRHFVRQYGLTAHWEDAEQCCAIAVHRAIETYDPAKAQFTTFVNWQIRGELQSLRFRLMTDQRPSARKVEAT
ncbi:sigma-70 family RNA polymerase sigma factor, partial [Escherichia coli]|nr:sigma-70 family RNA polymerase sigma factor [Escherichia coli]